VYAVGQFFNIKVDEKADFDFRVLHISQRLRLKNGMHLNDSFGFNNYFLGCAFLRETL